jgi:protein-S-isoprenylcysteine O-methyltransferase Ste14
MRRSAAAVGTAAFFVLAPGVVAGLVPWWLTRWQVRTPLPGWIVSRLLGGALIAAGLAFLIHAFARFVTEGAGTPAPVAPTERLVVGGAYRYVRNPMYLAVLSVIVGQALVLGQFHLLTYAAVIAAIMLAFVRGYEEPVLSRKFGAEYDVYRRNVPGWWPRLQNPYRNRS